MVSFIIYIKIKDNKCYKQQIYSTVPSSSANIDNSIKEPVGRSIKDPKNIHTRTNAAARGRI